MNLKYDAEADAIYIYLSEKPYAYGANLDDERRIDYASDSTPIGVELLCVSDGVNLDSLPRMDEIAEVLEISGIKSYTTQGYSVTEQVFDVILVASPRTEGTEKLTVRLTEKEEVTV